MKKSLSVILSAIIGITAAIFPLTSFAEPSRISIHDPSITLAENGKYYIVGSHLAMGESDDLINWNNMGYSMEGDNYLSIGGKSWIENLAEPLEWTSAWQNWCIGENEKAKNEDRDLPFKDYANEFEYNCWANDIIYNKAMDCYCLYGACSVWGTTASVIWLATSKNIEGPYEYKDSFIYSGITSNSSKMPNYNGLFYMDTNVKTDLIDTGLATEDEIEEKPWFDPRGYYDCGWGKYPNAIDPTAFTDKNGNMWLVYGSYSGGCFVIKLKNDTGTPDYEYMSKADGFDMYFGKRISNTNEGSQGTGEGPYILYDSQTDYYYFYLTYGGLDSRGGYNIREYRAKSPAGPYYDAAGNKATANKNTGLKIVGNYKFASNSNAYLSPGHSSSLIDNDGSMYQVYHTRFDGRWSNNTEGHEVRIHKMLRTQDGWAVMLPFEYRGEGDIKSITKDSVVGCYEFINSTDKSQSVADWRNSPNSDIILPTQKIWLGADGKVYGVKNYEYDEHHTNLGSTAVTGSWSIVSGTTYVNFTIDGVKYKGTFAKQLDESDAAQEKIVFAGKGNNNCTIWGVKDDSHVSHSLITSVTKATTSSNGKISKVCKTCGYVASSSTINKLSSITLSSTIYTYDGNTKKPSVTVKDSKGNKLSSSSYSLAYSNNKLVGKASVKITFKGNYSGTVTKTFKINPKGTALSSLSAQKSGFKANWKKQATQTTGYQVRYSKNSSMSNATTKTVSKNSTISLSVSKLTRNKTYYVQVRTYKTVNGVKYYSAWSGKKSVKTK